MKVNIQDAIAEYHKMMKQMGMNMHVFHATWHMTHRDPVPPPVPDENWGINNLFGDDFLQMHHEMVKAEDHEPKRFMHHQSIVSWFRSRNYDLPAEWNPLDPIPAELDFTTTNPRLKRITNDPKFQLPKYFTLQGIGPGEAPEPITRATRLSDFKNINQLGCCIIYSHNAWHKAIGGAMSYLSVAIDDPVFYFGVHWHIDKVFDDYKALGPLNHAPRKVPKEFTVEEKLQLKTAEEIGLKIWFTKSGDEILTSVLLENPPPTGEVVMLPADTCYYSVNGNPLFCNGEQLGIEYKAQFVKLLTEKCSPNSGIMKYSQFKLL